MNRREFLITTSVAALVPRITLASTPTELVAQPVSAQILPVGEPATPMPVSYTHLTLPTTPYV